MLLAAPGENLAASVAERSGGGVVTDPDDPRAWVAAARKLALDRRYREELGVRARKYAESAFDIRAIAGVFERVLDKACRNDTYRARVA